MFNLRKLHITVVAVLLLTACGGDDQSTPNNIVFGDTAADEGMSNDGTAGTSSDWMTQCIQNGIGFCGNPTLISGLDAAAGNSSDGGARAPDNDASNDDSGPVQAQACTPLPASSDQTCCVCSPSCSGAPNSWLCLRSPQDANCPAQPPTACEDSCSVADTVCSYCSEGSPIFTRCELGRWSRFSGVTVCGGQGTPQCP